VTASLAIQPRTPARLLATVVRRLRTAHEFDSLGNLPDPLDELVYIVLSTRTRGPVFARSFAALRQKYPAWDRAARARCESLETILAPAGLGRKKARWLKETLVEIDRREGRVSLDRLRKLSNEEAEAYLVSLPGVGLKTARCVLMYSLERQVFPVDANCRRLLERLGVLEPGIHYHDVHDAAQALVPARLRSDFHVYAVIHGRTTCLPRNPRCNRCPLVDLCAYGRIHTQAGSDLR
jgi:endonuclease III